MKKIIFAIFLIFMSLFLNINVVSAKVIFDKCIDGDTAQLKVNGEVKKVRFLAIDTPETKHPTKGEEPFGKEASKYTCDALTGAKTITLEYDENSDKTDKYDRLLAWVFVDGELLQAKLVENGLAEVAYLYGDYKYTSKLQKLEAQAKKDKVGIWGDYKENYTDTYILIGTIILIVVLCIFSKNIRKNVVTKSKRKINKTINKEIDKLFK